MHGYRVIKNILETRLHEISLEENDRKREKSEEASKMLRPLSDYESLCH